RRLRARRVDDAHLAEALQHPLGDLEGAAVDADVLAEDEDALVALHLLPDPLPDRLNVGRQGHVRPSTRAAPGPPLLMIDTRQALLRLRVRLFLRPGHRLVQLGLD